MDTDIAAGDLRHRITLMNAATQADSMGDVAAATIFAHVWAKVSPMSGQQSYRAAQFTSDANIQIVMRYMRGVMPTMTVTFGTRIFEILAVLNEQERNIKLVLLTKEIL